MTTTGYEVHVIRDRRWVVAERFANDAREDAIAAAKRMFNVDRLDGVRVFTEKFDNATQLFVPQYIMRDVRPGVKIARDAPVQAPAAPPARKVAAAPRAVAAQAASGAGWRPALGGTDPTPAFAGPAPPIAAPGAFNPDNYLQAVATGADPGRTQSAEQVSALREAGRRAFETAVLIAGLLMEGIGFAMLLALLDGSNATWNERPLWVGLAFGLLLGGLLIVVRQIGKLRALGSWFRRNDALEPYPTPRSYGGPKESSFSWRKVFDAVFFNKMPSKWPEPEPEPSAPKPLEAAQPAPAPIEEPPPAPQPAAEPAPIDQLTGFIAKYLHGPAVQGVVDTLTDDDSLFAAYLYLTGAADACVEAAGVGKRAPGLVLSAALDPLKLSASQSDDFALRRQLFQNDPRYVAVIDIGREAMATALSRRQADPDAMMVAVEEWRRRPPLADNERLFILAIEASLAMGGVPPEPSVVAHAFEDHKAMVDAVIQVYRGQEIGPNGCMAFRSAADAAAAAMEIQARRLELSMKEGAAPLDVRTVAVEFALPQFETRSIGDLLAGVRGLTALAIPGDVLVADTMRPTLSALGYRLRDFRSIPTPAGEQIRLAAIEWDGAPQVSAAPVAPASSPAPV
ncbi:MAG: hypothetical protein ACOVVK_04385 [Elsteraceae bacterium]